MRLRNKARIKLREGCVLIGVPDPKGVLEEDEIFVQIEQNYLKAVQNDEQLMSFDVESSSREMSKRLKKISKLQEFMGDSVKSRHVVSGRVIITKNPCVYPGDVRKVNTLTEES